MPPIQPSLRGSLLTGASALALSVTGYSAQAQVVTGQNTPSPWTVWVEGAVFQTGGGNINVPSLPGLSLPFMSFKPPGGWEGAFGFDNALTGGPYHIVFDYRAGISKKSNQSSHSSSFSSFFFSSNSQSGSERETHYVADLMIGRDFGLGLTTGQFQFGIRIADLSATVDVSGQHFFSSFGSGGSSSSASGTWNSRFFGVGPRAAVVGNTPIMGLWSVDYSGGIAGLIGNRTLDYSIFATPGGVTFGNYENVAFVFNADSWAALSYSFTPALKLSSGIRFDYYSSPLMTYNISTGGLTDVDRIFWGPFLRLTGKF
jgi:hypothetical protein